jgi:hypothetical protein
MVAGMLRHLRSLRLMVSRYRTERLLNSLTDLVDSSDETEAGSTLSWRKLRTRGCISCTFTVGAHVLFADTWIAARS